MNRVLALVALLLVSVAAVAQDLPNGRLTRLDGMLQPGMITREANGIPHVFAFNKHDLYFLNGWVHAQDRLWQMDTSRRIASGTLAELLGTPALGNDVQLRTFGLRRTAEATLPLMSTAARDAFSAYAAGVNAYIRTHALPPEYSYLEITEIPAWTPVDSIAIGKLIAFGLSFDLDLDPTIAFLTYQEGCRILGCNGQALFFADTWRIAPFSSAATVRDATSAGATLPLTTEPKGFSIPDGANVLRLLKAYREQIDDVPTLRGAIDPEQHAGSNEWAVAGRHTTTGNAMIANDPHLALDTPATFYPIGLRAGRLNVAGMSFPGAPFVIQGQNERIAWGSTVHPMDVTDLYREQLIPSSTSPSGFAAMYKGTPEPVSVIPQTFRANAIGNGVRNDLVTVPASATVPAATLVTRHGPIIQLDARTGTAVSVQYAGFYPTFELEAFMRIDEAGNVEEFRNALQFFDVGSQNFAYADIDGNIAYFTSGELPLREDLQLGTVTGAPPFFIREGTGGNEWMPAPQTRQTNQTLPFAILPFSEMPQVVNPSNGWFVNGNNDPTGHTLDNDPLNTLRANGGILYLNPGYDGIRGGRITQLIRARLANGGKISFDDMKAIQADVVLYDAQVFVPFITRALENAKASGAIPELAGLVSGNVEPAIGRLSRWNFTAPTGIATGYDAADTNGVLGTPSQAEIDASVAATIYSVWRGRMLANTVDAPLRAAGMPLAPGQQALSALRALLESWAQRKGAGFSGVQFFTVSPTITGDERRDILILRSLQEALTLLAGDAFAPAFNRSTNLDDYRWGRLHRIVFDHLTGFATFSPGAMFGPPPFPSVPPLQGVAVDGGFSVVDASSHNARAADANGFMFGSGPNRRFVGEMTPDGVRGESSLPGGVSGNPASPWFTNLLLPWLTNDTFTVTTDVGPRIPFGLRRP